MCVAQPAKPADATRDARDGGATRDGLARGERPHSPAARAGGGGGDAAAAGASGTARKRLRAPQAPGALAAALTGLRAVGASSGWRLPAFNVLIVTDVGPDPDDAKALLIAATLHKQRLLTLRAVIANGGHQEVQRARLARGLLDHVSCADVPVGIGSAGKAYVPMPHEYSLAGYDETGTDRLVDGPALFADVLRRVPARSLRVVLISSLRDFADMIAAHGALVVAKVHTVAIQGGLQPSPDGVAGWEPDTSVNNMFDLDAARSVYDFCFSAPLRMTVTSRNAVPMLPMQLARSFADRTACPVMSYLATAQFLGLEGLWQNLCRGKLPPRCSKQWYFKTFCGVPSAEFHARSFDALLGQHTAIVRHLNGFVKPYDVLAFMTVLPQTEHLFTAMDTAHHTHLGTTHLLLLHPEHTVNVNSVLNLLRETYHEVVFATIARARKLGVSHGGAADGASTRARKSSHGAERRSGRSAPGPRARPVPRMGAAKASLRASFKFVGTSEAAAFAVRGRRLTRSSSMELSAALDDADEGGDVAGLGAGSRPPSSAPSPLLGGTAGGSGGDDGGGGDGGGGGGGGSRRGGGGARYHAAVLTGAEIEAMLVEAVSAAQLRQRFAATVALALGLSIGLTTFAGWLADVAFAVWADADAQVADSVAVVAAELYAREGADGDALAARVEAARAAFMDESGAARDGAYALCTLAAILCGCALLATVHASRWRLRCAAGALSAFRLVQFVLMWWRGALPFAPRSGALETLVSGCETIAHGNGGVSIGVGVGVGVGAAAACGHGDARAGAGAHRAASVAFESLLLLALGPLALAVLVLAIATPASSEYGGRARWRPAHRRCFWPPSCAGGARPATIVRWTWRLQCVTGIAAGLQRLQLVARAAWAGLLPLWPARLLALRVTTGALLLVVGALFLLESARNAAGALAARCFVARGTDASIAALLGFGSRRGVYEPDELAAEAARSFRAFVLDAAARRELVRGGLLDTHARFVAPRVSAAGYDGAGEAPAAGGAGGVGGVGDACGAGAGAGGGAGGGGVGGGAAAAGACGGVRTANHDNGRIVPIVIASADASGARGGSVAGGGGDGADADDGGGSRARAEASGAFTQLRLGASGGSLAAPSARPSALAAAAGGGGGGVGSGGGSGSYSGALLASASRALMPLRRGSRSAGSSFCSADGGNGGNGGNGSFCSGDGGSCGRTSLASMTASSSRPPALLEMFAPDTSDVDASQRTHADAYVVHSFDDNAKDRAVALCTWAAAFEARHQRPPTVWLNQLCADMSLSTVQLLAHLPVYQAKCHRLLLLAGPTLPERLWCAMECYVWSAMGGRPEDVEVEIAAKDARSCQDIVAAFDAFHVINAVGTLPAVTDRIQRAVELATVANFNAKVRDFLPPVRQAGLRFGSRVDPLAGESRGDQGAGAGAQMGVGAGAGAGAADGGTPDARAGAAIGKSPGLPSLYAA